MENLNQLYEEKLERIDKTMRGQKADRVPVYSLVDNWAYTYSGISTDKIFADDEVHYEVMKKALGDFYWDGTFTACNYKAMNYLSELGGGAFTLDENGLIQVKTGEATAMKADDYDAFIKDPAGFIRDVAAVRKYELLSLPYSEEKYSRYCAAVDKLLAYRQMAVKFIARYKSELGLPVTRGGVWWHPLDLLLDHLRDFAGIMQDIKRQPQKVIAAVEAFLPFTVDFCRSAFPTPDKGKIIYVPFHIPEFLSPRDFAKVYWPVCKKTLTDFAESGYLIQLVLERNHEHLYDFYKDFPRGSITAMMEDDDLRKTKRELGGVISISGGMDLFTLNYGSKQKCLDMAKSLIDDLAPGGGYLFSQTRIMHSPNDAKAENLKAVNDFVHEYGKY